MAGGLDRSPRLTREAVLASTGRAGIHETGLSLDKTILVTARAALPGGMDPGRNGPENS